MGQPTLHERQRQLREDVILDAAYDLLLEHGYGEMSMDDVAARVGISKATLYQHFTSKEDLAVHVIVRAMQWSESSLDSVDPKLPAIQRLEIALRQSIERRASMWAGRLTMMPMNVIKHPHFQEHYAQMIGRIAAMVDAAKAEGALVQDVPTPIIIRLISGLFKMDYNEVLAEAGGTMPELSSMLVRSVFDGIRSGREASGALEQQR